jgi:XisH protein
MAAKDIYHDAIKAALIADNWLVTHDPYSLKILGFQQSIDLGAEKILAAEKENLKIAVEIKSFVGNSFIYDFHHALGQYVNYKLALRKKEPERVLYLGITQEIFDTYFDSPAVLEAIIEVEMKVLVVDVTSSKIVEWKR